MAGSEIKVNQISPKQTCTTITVGNSGNTIIIPAGATITNSGTATGFSRTGTVNWDTTVKTTTVTAVSGNGYFVNTTAGAITVNLPAGVAGAIVAVSDYANTAATNNITITPNSTDKINGVNGGYNLATNGASITFVYVDSTQGWKDINDATLNATGIPPFIVATGGTILTCGDYKTHVFTGPGTFTVTNAGNPTGSNSVEYLVVAGGGSGGNRYAGGGGGGGLRQNYPSPTTAGLPVTATGYPITVGGGGAGHPCSPPTFPGNEPGDRGSNSIFSTITSTGGGGGQGQVPAASPNLPGGSGGGGSYWNGVSGTGNTPPVSPSQGNPGGTGNPGGANTPYATGAGGGAGAAASAAPGPASGTGGNGAPLATTFFGPTAPSYGTPGPAPGRYFAGGGGGGATSQGATIGSGGAGGGSAGGNTAPGLTTNGTVNTGGGSGGGYGAAGGGSGSGGSGIVVIRYKFQ